MTQKKKAIAAGAAAVMLAGAAGIVAAYFSAADDEPNLATVGEDTISIVESFDPPEQTHDPFRYRKLVKIKNTGSVPCYIRARLEFSDSDIQSYASFSADESDPPAEGSFYSADKSKENPYIEHLPNGWVYINERGDGDPTEGYYYYTSPVQPEKATDALISWVKMSYPEGAEIQAHDLYVYSESVQTIDPATGAAYDGWKAAWNSFAG